MSVLVYELKTLWDREIIRTLKEYWRMHWGKYMKNPWNMMKSLM